MINYKDLAFSTLLACSTSCRLSILTISIFNFTKITIHTRLTHLYDQYHPRKINPRNRRYWTIQGTRPLRKQTQRMVKITWGVSLFLIYVELLPNDFEPGVNFNVGSREREGWGVVNFWNTTRRTYAHSTITRYWSYGTK